MIEEIRKKYFPMQLPDGVEARSVTSEVATDVMRLLWHSIFPDDKNIKYFRTVKERMAKQEALWKLHNTIHHERIVFYNKDKKPIGWIFGDMEDYMTFYLRLFGLLPEYRRKKIFSTFQSAFFEYLKEVGYERVAAHHHINNRAVLISQLKAGYGIVGFEVDERFGLLAKVLHFLHEDRRRGYEKVFSLPRDPIC